jgi:salicylate hydroxylase
MIDETFRICSTDGKEQNRIDLRAKVEYRGVRVVYHRQDLHDVLKASATSREGSGEPAIIRVSSRVASANYGEGSVELESGEISTGFDLVVGADGIQSLIRTSVLTQEINPEPTGLSAYRMMIKAPDIEGDVKISAFLNPSYSCTTMVMGYDCRLTMGPARNGEVYSIVAMVPDGKLGFQETLVSNLKQ